MTFPCRLMGTALVIACVLGMVGCGSNDNANNAAAVAVSQTLLNVSAPGEKLTTSQAACFGTGVIDAFGVDQAVKYGFITKTHAPVKSLSLMMTAKDAGTYADLYLKCANPMPAIKNALIARVAPTSSAAEQQLRSCLDKTLTPTLMRKALVAAATGDSSNASLTPVFTACGRLG